MAISILNEFQAAGSLLSPFMRPVLYFSVSGAGSVTNPTAEIEFDGTTEDVTIEAMFLKTVSSVHYFAVDLSDVMKYLMRYFDGGSYPDDLEFINGNLLQKFDEYARSLEIDIYFERGTANQQTTSIANYWIYLANQLPYAGGFRLDNVVDHSCMGPLKWNKNTYNALFFWSAAGTVTIGKGTTVIQQGYTADDSTLTADEGDITADTNVDTSAILAVNYGYLYNWYAATDARNIAAAGWHVPTSNEYVVLRTFLDPTGTSSLNVAGAILKESGTTHWSSGGGTNAVSFNGRGAGQRVSSGVFTRLLTHCYLWSSTTGPGELSAYAYDNYLLAISDIWNNGAVADAKTYGQSVRLVKDTTTLTDGQTGTYVGNDGKVYRTICIGTQEWLADNLCETLYRDGSPIPEVTDNGAWAALTTGARCSYDNVAANAFTPPTVVTPIPIVSETVTAGYFQFKFAKNSIYLDRGLNSITITTPGGTKTVIIDYDPVCPAIPVMWQHPLLGYVSYPFNGNKVTAVSGKKGVELDKFDLTQVNNNRLKEITGYDPEKKVTITTRADSEYWPLLEALYTSRHVYLFVGAEGANDTAGTWVECEVSGGASFRSDRTRGTFTAELTLPEQFNVRF